MLIEKSFYFIRHGETDHNRNRLCAGNRLDISLNKTGKHQARSLRDKVSSLPIEKVICSPMKRTIETATLATSHPLVVEHDLRECDLGDFEGTPVSSFIKHVETISSDTPFPNGESRTDVAKRAADAVNKHLSAHDKGLLFVSHGMVYWALLEILKIPFHFIKNAELIHLKPQDGTWAATRI